MSKASEERRKFRELRSLWMKEHGWKGFICARCGHYSKSVHLHHIKELIFGGENVPQNLIPLCGDCHRELDCYGSDFSFEHFIVSCPSLAMPVLSFPGMKAAREHFKTNELLRVCSVGYHQSNLAKTVDKLELDLKGITPSDLEVEQNHFFTAYPYSDDEWRSKRLDELYGSFPGQEAI